METDRKSIYYQNSDYPFVFTGEILNRVAPLVSTGHHIDKHCRPFLYPFETGRPIVFPQLDDPHQSPGARWLQSSFPLSVRYSKSYRVNKLVSHLMVELETVMGKTNPQKTRRMLETIVLNLLDARMSDIPVNYPRNSNEYSRRRTNGNGFFTRTYTLRVIDAMEVLGYIGKHIGNLNREIGDGWQTRMWGTPKLWATFEHYGLISTQSILDIHKPDEVLFLRERDDKKTGKKGADIHFTPTAYTRQVVADLERYNDFVDGFEVSVSFTGGVNVNSDFLADYLFRNILNSRITLTNVQFNRQSIIQQYDTIWTPNLLSVSIPPYMTQDIIQNTITNTKMNRRTGGMGFQRFDHRADRMMNFLSEVAKEYWSDKAYRQKKTAERRKRNKHYRPRKRKLPDYPLGRFGIDRLEFNLNYEYLHRVFRMNKSFNKGGRAYGAMHQNLPRHMRPFIRINGQPTKEIDYGAFHPLMLYHRKGIDYQHDPYSVCEGPDMRDIYKAVLLVAINARDDRRAYGGIQDELAERGIPTPEGKEPYVSMVRVVREAHQPISEYLFSDVGIELQNIDGNMMNAILVRLMDHGVLGLSVYDSVIVQAEHAEFLKEVMTDEYMKVMKYKPRF